jgi:hypothetical protein
MAFEKKKKKKKESTRKDDESEGNQWMVTRGQSGLSWASF